MIRDLVFVGAHRCRGEKLLPRLFGLKWAEGAQGAGLRRLRRWSGLSSERLRWCLRWIRLFRGLPRL